MKNNANKIKDSIEKKVLLIQKELSEFQKEKRRLSYEGYLLSSEEDERTNNYLENRRSLKLSKKNQNNSVSELKHVTETLKTLELERNNIQQAIKYRTSFSQEIGHTSFWHALFDSYILQEIEAGNLNGKEYKEYLDLTELFSQGKEARQDRTYSSPLLCKNANLLFPNLYKKNISRIEQFIQLKSTWKESGIGAYANYPTNLVISKLDKLQKLLSLSRSPKLFLNDNHEMLQIELAHEQLLLCESLIERLKNWPIHSDCFLNCTEKLLSLFPTNTDLEKIKNQMHSTLIRDDIKIYEISLCIKHIATCLQNPSSHFSHAKKIRNLKEQLQNIPVWPKDTQGEAILKIPTDDRFSHQLSQAHAIWVAENQLKPMYQSLIQHDLRELFPLKNLDTEGHITWLKSHKTIVSYGRKALEQLRQIQQAIKPNRITAFIVQLFPRLKTWLFPYQTPLFQNLFDHVNLSINEKTVTLVEQAILTHERTVYQQILKDVQEIYRQLPSFSQNATDLQIQEKIDTLRRADLFIERYRNTHPKESQHDTVHADILKVLRASIERNTLTQENIEDIAQFMARGKISSYTSEQIHAVQLLKAVFFGHPGVLDKASLQEKLHPLFLHHTTNILQIILTQLQEQYLSQHSFLQSLLLSNVEKEPSPDEKRLYSDLYHRYSILITLSCSLPEPLKILTFEEIIIDNEFSDATHPAWQQMAISCQLYKKYGGTPTLTSKLHDLKKQALEIGLQFSQKNSLKSLYLYDSLLAPLFTSTLNSHHKKWRHPFAHHILQLQINDHPLMKIGKATPSEIKQLQEWLYTLKSHGGTETLSAEYDFLEKTVKTLSDKLLITLESKDGGDLKSLLLFFDVMEYGDVHNHVPLSRGNQSYLQQQVKIKQYLTKKLHACCTKEEFNELNSLIPSSLKNLLFEEGLQYYQKFSAPETETNSIQIALEKLSAQDAQGHIYPRFMFDAVRKHQEKLSKNTIFTSNTLFVNNPPQDIQQKNQSEQRSEANKKVGAIVPSHPEG